MNRFKAPEEKSLKLTHDNEYKYRLLLLPIVYHNILYLYHRVFLSPPCNQASLQSSKIRSA